MRATAWASAPSPLATFTARQPTTPVRATPLRSSVFTYVTLPKSDREDLKRMAYEKGLWIGDLIGTLLTPTLEEWRQLNMTTTAKTLKAAHRRLSLQPSAGHPHSHLIPSPSRSRCSP